MSQDPDSLGLDKPIKLGRVSKIPKITDELLFDRVRGLPHIITNYKKVARTIRKNDKAYAQKSKDARSKLALHHAKVETECQNLASVLQFYQLWCHGLFPRANFSDCVQMLRKYKSPRMRMYRRELIDKEMHRQRVEKGIITEDAPANSDMDELYDAPDASGIAAVDDETGGNDGSAAVANDQDEDDEESWGFLSVRRRPNGLFVDDDEDGDDNNTAAAPEAAKPVSRAAPPAIDDDDDFPDDQEYPEVPDSVLQETAFEDEYDNELELLREMGM